MGTLALVGAVLLVGGKLLSSTLMLVIGVGIFGACAVVGLFALLFALS